MISNEIREILALTCSALNKYDVEYMLIGGTAVGFYGYQRISGGYAPGFNDLKHDLDFWYNPTTGNYYNLVQALKDLDIETESLENLIFDPKRTYLKIPHKGFKTEFLPQMSGLDSFSGSIKTAKKVNIDNNDILIIGYDDLIKNKKAVNRTIDKTDIIMLDKLNKD